MVAICYRKGDLCGFSAEKNLALYGLARATHKNGDPTAFKQVEKCYQTLKKMGHYQAPSIRVWLNRNREHHA